MNEIKENRQIETKKGDGKVKKLVKSIVVYGIAVIILIIAVYVTYRIYDSNREKILQSIQDKTRRNFNLEKEIIDFQNKIESVQKYHSMITENTDIFLKGVDATFLKTQLDIIALNNGLINFTTAVSEENLVEEPTFKKENIFVYNNEIDINFYSVTDVNAYSFIDDLYNYLSKYYFPFFQVVDIKRIGKTDEMFLLDLKSGKYYPAVVGNIKISLYTLRFDNATFLNEPLNKERQ
ncbi:MAG: hypothetical protein LBH46_02060 [Rickettsiales bacterium]|jgi:cell division protein FtsL|nr:hypothetical protein [Rickettsiales bacterium]